MNEWPLTAHFGALRVTLIQLLSIIGASALIAFFFAETIIAFLVAPLHSIDREINLALFSPAEGLILSIKLSLWVGFFASLPLALIPLIRFLKPALYPHEARLLLPFVLLSFATLALALYIGYTISLPLANHYFFTYNSSLGINLWGLGHYLDYTLNLLGAHVLGFELMLALFFLVHLGLVRYDTLKAKRRHAIVAALILGALLTPPDVLSQLLLAIPLILLFELSLLYARSRS